MVYLGIVAIGKDPDVRNILCEKVTRPEHSLLGDLLQESRHLGGFVLLVAPGFPRVSLQPMYENDISNNYTVVCTLV